MRLSSLVSIPNISGGIFLMRVDNVDRPLVEVRKPLIPEVKVEPKPKKVEGQVDVRV